MNRKVPVGFGAREKVEITSKPYLLLWTLAEIGRKSSASMRSSEVFITAL